MNVAVRMELLMRAASNRLTFTGPWTRTTLAGVYRRFR